GQEGAEKTADPMDAESIQRVVVFEEWFQAYSHITDRPSQQADDHAREGGHETGGGSDRYQSSHEAGGQAQCGWLAPVNPLDGHPAESGGRRGQLRSRQSRPCLSTAA